MPHPDRTAVRRASCRSLFALALLFQVATSVGAQVVEEIPPPGEAIYEVRLADGSTIFARISAVEGDQVVFTTLGGSRFEVARDQIRELEPAQGRVVDGEYWRSDPNVTRLYFGATGRTLGRGQAYVGTYFILLPFVAVGLTDRFTMAAGAPVVLGELEPFYIAPKIGIIQTETANVSVGTLLFFFNDENVGIAYGAGTFGSVDRSLTLGLGFGYSGDDFSSQPVAMIGGEVRVGRRAKWMTESYFLPGETGFATSLGIRFIGERFSTDVGVAAATDGGDLACCAPLLNFSYAFGRR